MLGINNFEQQYITFYTLLYYIINLLYMKIVATLLCCVALSIQGSGQKQLVLDAFKNHGLDPAILEPQSVQTPESCSYDLKVTTISTGKEKVVTAHHDADKTGDDRWSVQTVNGKSPNNAAIKAFRKEHGQPVRPSTGIDEATLRIDKETPTQLLISYKVRTAELPSEAAFLKNCRIHLTINLETKRLEQMQTLNEEPVKIKIFTAEKLDLTVSYRYDEALHKYVSVREDLNLLIKLLGQLSPIETISEYSNFSSCK